MIEPLCQFCNQKMIGLSSIINKCYACKVEFWKVSWNNPLMTGEMSFLITIDQKEYRLNCSNKHTSLVHNHKNIIKLEYPVRLTPITAPEFAHRLLQNLAFS